MSNPLLKLLKKKKYLSEDPEMTYRTACKGVTPFSVGQQDLDDVATTTKLFDQLAQANMVIPVDISKLAKMPALVPETGSSRYKHIISSGEKSQT